MDLIVTGVVGDVSERVFDALVDLVAAGLADECLSPAGLFLMPIGEIVGNGAVWHRRRAGNNALSAVQAYGGVRALLAGSGSKAVGPFCGMLLVSLVGLGVAAEVASCGSRHGDCRNR